MKFEKKSRKNGDRPISREIVINKIQFGLTVMALAVGLGGCERQKQAEENKTAPTPERKAAGGNAVTDQWLGQWNGPEGTFLLLFKNGDKYAVKINSLDGPATYEGIAMGDHIEFQRDGKTESIRAGSGKHTGMKWLLGEKNCLVIKTGEGFCR